MNALCKGNYNGLMENNLNVLYKVNIIPSITFNNGLRMWVTLTYTLKKHRI